MPLLAISHRKGAVCLNHKQICIWKFLKGPWNTFLTNHRMALPLKDITSRTPCQKHFSNPTIISGDIAPIPGFLALFISTSAVEATQWRSQEGKAPVKSSVSWRQKGLSQHPVLVAVDFATQHAAAKTKWFFCLHIYISFILLKVMNYVLQRMLSRSRNQPIALVGQLLLMALW